jgi:hypothetical protein
VKYTETSFNVFIMTLRMFVVNFIKQLYIFIISLFGVKINAFYQVDCAGGEVSSIAHFSLTYLMVERKTEKCPRT